MHPHTQIDQNSISSTSIDEQQHQDLDHSSNKSNDQNILKSEPDDHNRSNNDQNILKSEPDDHQDLDLDHDDSVYLDQDDGDTDGKNILNSEHGSFYCMDNDPPESYAVCHTKVADWLDRNTFMERNPSVKFACSKNLDLCQMPPSSRRSVSTNQQPKLSIIGFRKKPVHHMDGKAKQNERVENVRLFRNRSEPGRDYCLLITEPVSPRVSCAGRVGSVRVVQRRKAGVWRSFKAVFSNLLQTNRVTKLAA